jgi:hypothetical protein
VSRRVIGTERTMPDHDGSRIQRLDLVDGSNSTLFDPPLMTRAFGGHLPTTDTRSLAAQTDAGCLRKPGKPGWKGTHNTALSRTTGHRDYSAGHRGHRPKATARAVLTRPSRFALSIMSTASDALTSLAARHCLAHAS